MMLYGSFYDYLDTVCNIERMISSWRDNKFTVNLCVLGITDLVLKVAPFCYLLCYFGS